MRKQNSNADLAFYFTVIKRHSTSNLNLRPIHNFLTQLCINFQKYDFLKIIMKYLLFISFWLIINFVTHKDMSYRMKWKLPQRSLEAHSP